MKKALRYIDAHLSDELRLEGGGGTSISARTTSANCFKKNIRGSYFNAFGSTSSGWRAQRAACHSDWSIASIARNLGFSQTSYFL